MVLVSRAEQNIPSGTYDKGQGSRCGEAAHGGRRRIRYLVGLVLFLLHPIGGLASITGPGVSVLDGDTIEVLHNQHPERIRLSGIDCPEKA